MFECVDTESFACCEKYADKTPGVVVIQTVLGLKLERMLLWKCIVSPKILSSTGRPSMDNPFSHPVTMVLKTEVAVFLLNLKAFSNFSPIGRETVPSLFAPIIVKLEKIGAVNG